MSHSRFSIFHMLPSEWQEKMYTYLPPAEMINSRQDVRSGPVRMRALFSNYSDQSLYLQKRLLNYWMRYSNACPLSAGFLKDRLNSNENFYDTPLHHQLSVLAVHNKLMGKNSGFVVINDYAKQLLLNAGVLSKKEYVDFFKQTVALLNDHNQYELALICLEEIYKTAETNVKFLLGDLSLYLDEDQILKILLAEAFLIKLGGLIFQTSRCPFSKAVIELINGLSIKNKIKVIRHFLDYFSENEETPESIFYLLASFIDSVSGTSAAVDGEYQHLLAEIAEIVPNVLALKANARVFSVLEPEALWVLRNIFMASNDEVVKVKIVQLFRRMISGESPRRLEDDVYEVVWNAAVLEGDYLEVIRLLSHFSRLTHLGWSQLIEDKVVDWLVSEPVANGYHRVNSYLNKMIKKIVNPSNLTRVINIFLEVYELHASKHILDNAFWKAFRSFFGHPGVNHQQRQRLLNSLMLEINRGAHSVYFSLPIHRLKEDERGRVFSAVLTKNAEEPSSSLIDVLCEMSKMRLPVSLIEGFIATLIKFLLSKTEKKLPASIDKLYSSIINLSKQSFSDNTAGEIFALLDNELIGCDKFILLKSFFASHSLYKYWDMVFGVLKKLLCQECVPSQEIFNAFKKYVYLASRENPGVLVECIDFFIANIESVNMAACLDMLECLTGQSLIQPALSKCASFLFSNDLCEKTLFNDVRSKILMNLAEYSYLSAESIPAFFDYAKERLKLNVSDEYIEAFKLLGWLLQQASLPLFIQKEIQDVAFAALHFDCQERIFSAVLLLKACHKAGWSVGTSIPGANQARLFELADHAEEQLRYEVMTLLNVLPGLEIKSNSLTCPSPESILLIAIQKERELWVKRDASCSKASSSHIAWV